MEHPSFNRHIDELVARGETRNLHSVIALVHGEPIIEWYGSGLDFKWSESLGVVAFDRNTLHDIRSVTKSVVALLYGIALGQGQAPGPDEPLMRYFSQYPDLAGDPRLARLTVRHALTMTLGLDWNEDVPYTTLENSELAMELAPDRYRYILERPVVAEPGSTWRYSGGASALLGYLIQQGTTKPVAGFAREVLFGPLGIDSFEWMAGPDGTPSAASGLRLRPWDLARIGQMVLQRGRWQGRELVAPAWLDEMTKPHVSIAPGFDYGYQWYIGTVLADEPATAGREGTGTRLSWFGGIGNGDQRLWILPQLDLVVVMTAGNYNDWSDREMPLRVLKAVLRAVRAHTQGGPTAP